jgi:hypothetical protein
LPAPPSNRAPQSQAAPGKIGRVTTKARRGDQSLQTDPTGYDDGLNWYAYVGNDPLNRSDPDGLEAVDPVTVTASRGNCGRACYESLAGDRILPNGKTPYQQCGWSCTYQQGQQDMLADQAAEDNWYWAIPALAPEMAVDAIGVVGAIGARTAAISVRGLVVTFGRDANQVYHTFRHVEGIGMSASSVSRAVTSDLAKVAKSVAPGSGVRRTIAIGSIRVEYRAFKLPNGSMNVGSIFAVGSKR